MIHGAPWSLAPYLCISKPQVRRLNRGSPQLLVSTQVRCTLIMNRAYVSMGYVCLRRLEGTLQGSATHNKTYM